MKPGHHKVKITAVKYAEETVWSTAAYDYAHEPASMHSSWMFSNHPVLLPQQTTFSMSLTFGKTAQKPKAAPVVYDIWGEPVGTSLPKGEPPE